VAEPTVIPSITANASLDWIVITEATASIRRCEGCVDESSTPRGPRLVINCTTVASTNKAPIAAQVRHDNN
jgi:hypothetical protein